MASDSEVSQIKQFAANLSEAEDDAISATLAELALKGGISSSAIKDISEYLDAARSDRGRYVRAQKLIGVGLAATALIGGAIGGPLLMWLPAVAAAVGGMASGAVTAVSIGSLAGGLATGAAIGKLARSPFQNAAKNYGVSD